MTSGFHAHWLRPLLPMALQTLLLALVLIPSGLIWRL